MDVDEGLDNFISHVTTA